MTITGHDSLDALKDVWQTIRPGTGPLQSYTFRRRHGTSPDHLDDIDLRMLDVCTVLGKVDHFVQSIADTELLPQMQVYLRTRGWADDAILQAAAALINHAATHLHVISPLGRFFQAHLPQFFESIDRGIAHDHDRIKLITLLLDMQPPLVDLAEETFHRMQGAGKGEAVTRLFRVDPVRFTALARQVAGPNNQLDAKERLTALQALIAHDPANNVDLALAAAQFSPTLRGGQAANELRNFGLASAFRHDPCAYLPWVEAVALGDDHHRARWAVDLLGDIDPHLSRSILQHCVAGKDVKVASHAMHKLLEQPDGDEAYVISLLAHRSNYIRDRASSWLVRRGAAMFDAVAPVLHHKNADARSAAIFALVQIDASRARPMLLERLKEEKSPVIRKDIVIALESARTAPDQPPSPESVVADAEFTMQHINAVTPPWLDAHPLPALRWTNGEPVPPVVGSYVLYAQSRSLNSWLEPRVAAMLPLIERAPVGDWAATAWKAWLAAGAPAKDAWIVALLGAWGDERLVVPMSTQITAWSKGARGAIAVRVVYGLALISSDLALAAVDHLAATSSHAQVSAAAQKAFDTTAARLGISTDELADRVVPRLGFHNDGTRVFDYGARQITAKLGIDLQVSVLNGTKRATSLPKPLAADDPARAAQAQTEFKQLKAQLKHAIKQQMERMERALVTQRTWTTERWQALFLHHPLLRPLAINLVWGVVAEGETHGDGSPYTLLFRPLDDGTLTDADDETVTLPQTGQVRLVHPLDLDADTLRMWQQHLADYEIAPPFAQLNRTVVRLNDTLRTARWWEACLGYVINGAALKGRYLKAGWERGSVQDAGWYSTLLKAFPAAGIQAVLQTTGLSIGYEQNVTTALKRLAFIPASSMRTGSYVYDDLKDDDARIMLLGDVPAVVFSEAAADVQAFAAAGTYAADWEKQIW